MIEAIDYQSCSKCGGFVSIEQSTCLTGLEERCMNCGNIKFIPAPKRAYRTLSGIEARAQKYKKNPVGRPKASAPPNIKPVCGYIGCNNRCKRMNGKTCSYKCRTKKREFEKKLREEINGEG